MRSAIDLEYTTPGAVAAAHVVTRIRRRATGFLSGDGRQKQWIDVMGYCRVRNLVPEADAGGIGLTVVLTLLYHVNVAARKSLSERLYNKNESVARGLVLRSVNLNPQELLDRDRQNAR